MEQFDFHIPQPLAVGNNIKEDFKRFRQEIEIYFEATETVKKPMRTQVARLLNLMGQEALALYNTLEVSNDEEVTVTKILDALEKYCEPRKNLPLQHYRFFNRKQREDESYEDYYMALKQAIKSCEFGKVEESILKSQFIMGLKNRNIQMHLLQEEMPLNKVVDYCKAAELVMGTSDAVEALGSQAEGVDAAYHKSSNENKSVNKRQLGISEFNVNTNNSNSRIKSNSNSFNNSNRNKFKVNQTDRKTKCGKCDQSHPYGQCPAFGKTCFKCEALGHLAKCCTRGSTIKTHEGEFHQYRGDEFTSESESDCEFLEVSHIALNTDALRRENSQTNTISTSGDYRNDMNESRKQAPLDTHKPLMLSDIKSSDELKTLSVKQLKELLMRSRTDFTGCIEKKELIEEAKRLWNDYKISRKDLESPTLDELCKICMDAPIECVLLECGHMATCASCGEQLCECPICRLFVVRCVRTYKA